MLTKVDRRRGNESGAVAVMFALLAVMLMSLAALGTDIGNQVSRHSDTQRQADFGAFAAAQQMTGTEKAGATVSPAIIDAVVTSMNTNQVQDDNTAKITCIQANNCVKAADLTDTNLTNGEVRYTSEGLQVVAPDHYVSFGMARIMGFQGADVGGRATVNIFSPGLRVLPMFAVLGCDYGLQTLADPANGHDTPTTPTLAFNAETNSTQISNPPGLIVRDSTGLAVNSLAYQSTGNTLTVEASKWDNSRWIGFFRGDDTSPTLIQKVAVPGSPFTKSQPTPVTVNIPDAVTQTETAWYVRIYDSTGTEDPITVGHTPGTWSAASEALGI